MADILGFDSFDDFDNKLGSYLKNNTLDEQFEKCKIDAIKKMVDKFNLLSYQDTRQLAFLMWMLEKKFKVLLNDGYLLNKINLDMFEKKIIQCAPEVNITGYAGSTPLGGPRASFNDSLSCYDCIKFIGQFTNQQKIYDKCLQILEAMPKKLIGPILDPPQIMHLMNYNENSNINHHHNKCKSGDYNLNKLYDFHYSIYKPNPSQEREYNRYKKDMQQAFYDIASTNSTNSIGHICLIDTIVHSHYHIIKSMDQFMFRKEIEISNESALIIKQILFDISNEKVIIDEEEIKIQTQIKMREKINNKLRFISGSDEREIENIFSDAYIYVSDENINEEKLKKKLLIELYERKIVDSDSKLSHNLARNAAEFGRLWIIKFLIERGCQVKNLPVYSNDHWKLESKQLIDILKEDVKDHNGFGTDWVLKRKNDKFKVLEYLLRNNFI